MALLCDVFKRFEETIHQFGIGMGADTLVRPLLLRLGMVLVQMRLSCISPALVALAATTSHPIGASEPDSGSPSGSAVKASGGSSWKTGVGFLGISFVLMLEFLVTFA